MHHLEPEDLSVHIAIWTSLLVSDTMQILWKTRRSVMNPLGILVKVSIVTVAEFGQISNRIK